MSGAISSRHQVDHRRRVRELGEDGVAVQPEDLGHRVLGVRHRQPALLLSGRTLTPSRGRQLGVPDDLGHPARASPRTSRTRANPSMRKKPRSVPRRPLLVASASSTQALTPSAPPGGRAAVADRAGPGHRRHVAGDHRTHRDPGPLDRRMREAPLAPGRPVGEVDDGVHPTDGTGAVRPGQVERQAVVEGDRPGRHLDEHRLDPGQLAPGASGSSPRRR